ncbi:MAG: dihydroorotate dehydrogenase electron transfer subunit, partial [Candidatus Omnitrophica bacterium]|nr:dihydroorotate dehydrogenase electron transfer subunit [Candidatus Omnitrophota bacterium]
VQGDTVEVLYEILGHGTALLSRKPAGAPLRVLGPLGKPFRAKLTRGVQRVLVAGGIGVPPLVFLAERQGADYLLIGAKSRAEVLPKKELSHLGCKILYATNDGSHGVKGFVTVLLEELIAQTDPKKLFIQTCGPKVMMQAVLDRAAKAGIAGEASIDEGMACGVGACLGCMVETDKGLVPSCTEGPVFGFHQIKQSLTEV